MSITHEAMVELIVETLDAVDGAGSDLEVGRRDGEWLAVHGNLDVHHLASDVLSAIEPRIITMSAELGALPLGSVVLDSANTTRTYVASAEGERYFADCYGEDGVLTLPATALYEPTV